MLPNLDEEIRITSELSTDATPRFIAGCDEAGRGSYAGPLVAAAVILPLDAVLPDITDSKKINKKKHVAYSKQIMDAALAIGIGIADSSYIDRFGVGAANKYAIEEAVKDLPLTPDHVLIDGADQQIVSISMPQSQIVQGDSKSLSIAAASIIAKTTHDLIMKEYHDVYPEYGWDTNTGYGTQAHIEAIKNFGVCEHHRKSFKPIKEFIQKQQLTGGQGQ